MAVRAFERISIDHAKMGGLPCIRDLRIPVSTVLGQLAAGCAEVEILQNFPDLENMDVMTALEYAVVAVQERGLPLVVGQCGSSSSAPASWPGWASTGCPVCSTDERY
ncbi:MAG: DUF433 domain-containing protein [Pseudonocardiaceae bacterium]